MEQEIFLTPEETAVILKVNVRQVTKMIKSGELHAKDISQGEHKRMTWRILKTDVVKIAGQ